MEWATFDNATGIATDVGGSVRSANREPRLRAALMEPGRTEQFVQVSVAAIHPKCPTWATPVTVHFRRGAEGQPWTLVGLVRLPDNRRAADRVTTSADTFA